MPPTRLAAPCRAVLSCSISLMSLIVRPAFAQDSPPAAATALPPGDRLSHTTVVINAAILVLREGLETILVLAAVTASRRIIIETVVL